jgi:hypothetical protein
MNLRIAATRCNTRTPACRLLSRAFLTVAVLLALAPLPGPARPAPAPVRVPFRSVGSMILVEGKVNGNPANFLLDTGSVSTIVSHRFYKLTFVPLQGVRRNPTGHGINGDSVTVLLEIQLGNRRWVSQRVAIMNLDELSSILGVRHIDGLIGEDLLREFNSVRIDYRMHTIELEE